MGNLMSANELAGKVAIVTGARLRQLLRDGAADIAPGAGDDGDLTGEFVSTHQIPHCVALLSLPLPSWERSDREAVRVRGQVIFDRSIPLTPTLSHKGRGSSPAFAAAIVVTPVAMSDRFSCRTA